MATSPQDPQKGEAEGPSLTPGHQPLSPAPEEAISAAEARFEELRHKLGLWLGPPLGLLVWLGGEDSPRQRLAGLMAFAAIWWFTEPIPMAVTALLAVALAVLLGVATSKEAFAAFGNPLLFLFVGSFFLAEAMKLHQLGARLARAVTGLARSRLGVLVTLSLSAFAVSLWISNVAATAIFLPIALSVAQTSRDRRFGAALVLSIAYGASVGGIGTPVGTPPNLIGLSALRDRAGVDIGFLTFMSVGLPLGLIMLGVLWVLLALRFGVNFKTPAKLEETAARPWSRGEVAAASAFGLAVTMWLTPGLLELCAPSDAGIRALLSAIKKTLSLVDLEIPPETLLQSLARWTKGHLTEEVSALLAAGLLFLWPIGGSPREPRRALSWEEATRIDWGTVLLFGGAILLGDLAGKTGLSEHWGKLLVELTGASSLWAITALVTGASIALSEATSNTATATLMLPLTLSLAAAAHVSPVPPALGATLGASFGFMLPISTAPNAMAYGTGQVSIRQMASSGIIFDLLGFVVLLGGLFVLCPLLGLA